MHSFQPSRGRVLFEVLCALTVSASCAAAWMQTGASALLGAAGAAALYGLVHLFDMRRPTPVPAVEPQRVEFEPEVPEIILPMAAAEVADAPVAEEAAALGPAPSRAGSGRRSGGSRKGNGRRVKAAKAAKATELALADEAEAPWPIAEAAAPATQEELASIPELEAAHPPHIAPLFEPEPFARMPRPAFGRRGRL